MWNILLPSVCVDTVIADSITLMSFRLVFGEGPGQALRTRWITLPSPAQMNYYIWGHLIVPAVTMMTLFLWYPHTTEVEHTSTPYIHMGTVRLFTYYCINIVLPLVFGHGNTMVILKIHCQYHGTLLLKNLGLVRFFSIITPVNSVTWYFWNQFNI